MISQIFLKFALNLKKRKRSMGNFFNYRLVIDVIKDLEKTRKCWRLVGGALVEKTVGDVKPSLE